MSKGGEVAGGVEPEACGSWPRANPAGAWWRAAAAFAWVAGVALQMQQAALWPGEAYRVCVAGGLAAALIALRLRRNTARADTGRARTGRARTLAVHVAVLVAAGVLGFALAGWRAELRLADALAPEWEGRDIELVGRVDEMPQLAEDGVHFVFVVDAARALPRSPHAAGRAHARQEAPSARARAAEGKEGAPEPAAAEVPQVPSRVWLAWSRSPRADPATAPSAPLVRAGQRWRLPVRLRRPHGALNPDGFDAELWLFEQGLRATGSVRGEGELLEETFAPIERGRQWVRDRLLLAVADPREAGVLAGLAVGDQAAVGGPAWELFRNTGVAHLVSISGLHITMLGWLGGAGVGALWRRSERAVLRLPAPLAARWGGVAVAWAYALFAGWGVPARRTVVMLASVAGLRSLGLDWPAPLVALVAMVPVTALDPWALLQPGFWLSFAAVALLMVSEPARAPPDVAGADPGKSASADSARSEGADPARRAGADRGRSASRDPAPSEGADPARQAGADPATSEAADRAPPAGGGTAHSAAADTRGSASADPRASPTSPSPSRSPDSQSPASRPARAAARQVGLVIVRAAQALAASLRTGARAQVVACLGLAPLTLVAFEQVAPVGLLANLLAEPWITLVVTPLTLAGIVLPPLWQLAALALAPLLALLEALGRWPHATVHVASAPAWALVAGLTGGAVLVLALPWRVRALGLPLLLPLLAPFVPRPATGRFELVAVDVGQGSAVLVRTREHLLLFDAGPRFGAESDAGRRMLLPLLYARGEARVDTLVLSHADADHVGGVQAILEGLPVLALRSSLAADHPLRRTPVPHVPCAAGQSWVWDGVRFDMLHPLSPANPAGAKTNALSCVLRVGDVAGRSVLLTGDIEAPQEAAIVARAAAALRSDVLLVPHHGSRTSSTDAFLAAVRPRVAVIQVGYRSRYGHPAPEVLARYAAHGIPVVRTDHCGAWIWIDDQAHCTRSVRRRYWHWPGAPQLAGSGRPERPSSAGSDVAMDTGGTPCGAAFSNVPGAGSP
jgi:competence protein ComEC